MKIENLKLFIQVVESGSINQAAKQCHITQQGLSQTLKHLETELGVILFKRNHKGLQLTPEGEKFYHYSQHSVRAYNDFLDDLHKDSNDGVFNLYISNNDSNILPYLSDAPFMKRNNWYFSYITRSTAECIHLINNNSGVYFFSLYSHSASNNSLLENLNKEFPIYKVGSDTLTLQVCHKDSPLLTIDNIDERRETMLRYKCILFSAPTFDLNQKADYYRRSICVTDLDSYKKLLRERDTYTVLTYNHYKLHFDPLEYIVFREKPLHKEISYYVVFHLPENEKNKKLEQELVRYLKEILEPK